MWHSSRHFLLYCHNSYKLFVRLIVHHPFSFCFVLLDSLQVEVFILYFWISYKLCPVSSSPLFYGFTHCSLPCRWAFFSSILGNHTSFFVSFSLLVCSWAFSSHFWNSYELFCLAFSLLFHMASNITEAVSWSLLAIIISTTVIGLLAYLLMMTLL